MMSFRSAARRSSRILRARRWASCVRSRWRPVLAGLGDFRFDGEVHVVFQPPHDGGLVVQVMILGLDSTFELPNELSNFTVLLMSPPAAAFGLRYCKEKEIP